MVAVTLAAVSNESVSISVVMRSSEASHTQAPDVAVEAVQINVIERPLARFAPCGHTETKIADSSVVSSKSNTAILLRVSRVAKFVAGGWLSFGPVKRTRDFVNGPVAPVAKPTEELEENQYYSWNESTLTWDIV